MYNTMTIDIIVYESMCMRVDVHEEGAKNDDSEC